MKRSLPVVGGPISTTTSPTISWKPVSTSALSLGVFTPSDRVDCTDLVLAVFDACENQGIGVQAFAHNDVVDVWRARLGRYDRKLNDLGKDSAEAKERVNNVDSFVLLVGYETLCLLRPTRSVLVTGFLPRSKWYAPASAYMNDIDVQMPLARPRFAEEMLKNLHR